DSDCDEINSAKIALMVNLSYYGSDDLAESNIVNQSETEITSDSNIIPYSQYTDMVIHTVKIEIMRLVVKIECVDMNDDEFDKKTGLFDGLQPEQADLNCVHPLNKPHLHEIRVVPSKHEADQQSLCANPLRV
nr:hypothetical protein [Tanacetum cinerariifolium]